MARRNALLRTVLGTIVVVLVVVVTLTTVYDWQFYSNRRARKEWHDREYIAAQRNLEHMVGLVKTTTDYAVTNEWQRRTARSIVSSLTRLPGESIESSNGKFTGPRWETVKAYLLTCPEVFEFDSNGGVWVVRESIDCGRGFGSEER